MTALLTDNLPLLAGAPNGIKKLRELILELAVRGKLVPQDSNDEPASELLKSIAEGKAQLIAGGKKQKPQAAISEEEKPFSLPLNWAWVRLGSTLEMINGRAFKPTEWIAAGLPIVRIQNLNKPDAPFNYCNPDTVDDRHVIDTGTILISWSGTPGTSFGAFIWERGKAALNQHIFSCFQIGDAFFDKFLKLAINTRLDELIAKAHGGVGLQHVTKGKLEALTLVLPPLAEQHRIVAKVDELMALCDRLEAQQADAESAHAQLVQALLDSLTQASDATDFATNWQRLAEHFHTLFTTEPSIDTLKQTLLQLAVMGKLVPQNSDAEPASDLYERVSTWKDNLVKNKIYQKTAALKPRQDIRTFPDGWLKVQIGEICPSIVPVRDKPKSFSGGTPWVTLSSFPENDWFLDESKSEIGLTSEEVAKYGVRIIPVGSVMMSCIGRFGLSAINRVPVVTNQQIHSFVTHQDIVPEFLVFVIKVASRDLERLATSTTIAYLNKSNCESIELGLPSTKEQHRIVAKVDQLMALCDQLKTRLTQARQLNEQLASTLVEQAVA